MTRGLFRRIRRSRRQLLAQEADRAGRWLVSIVASARSMGAVVPDEVTASMVVLRVWAAYLERWAEEAGR